MPKALSDTIRKVRDAKREEWEGIEIDGSDLDDSRRLEKVLLCDVVIELDKAADKLDRIEQLREERGQ